MLKKKKLKAKNIELSDDDDQKSFPITIDSDLWNFPEIPDPLDLSPWCFPFHLWSCCCRAKCCCRRDCLDCPGSFLGNFRGDFVAWSWAAQFREDSADHLTFDSCFHHRTSSNRCRFGCESRTFAADSFHFQALVEVADGSCWLDGAAETCFASRNRGDLKRIAIIFW